MPRILDRLTRIVTPGRRFIPEIDGLRFVAIALVAFYHVSQWILIRGAASTQAPFLVESLNRVGYYGVELFFVISGFVLSLPFARAALTGARAVRLRAYYMRRVTRLEPPYMIVLFVVFIAYATIIGDFGEWRHALASAVYQHNLIYGVSNPFLGPLWSLEVEIQFYILTPLLARVFTIPSRKKRRALLCVIIAAMALITGSPRAERWHLSVAGHFQEFLAGYLLADLYVVDWKEAPAPSFWWDVVSLLGWPALMAAVARRAPLNTFLPFLVFAVYCAAFRGRISRRIFSWPWISTIGGMCYTIYLLHVPLIRLLSKSLGHLWAPAAYSRVFVLHAAAELPVVLAASVIFFMLIERPCMNPRWPFELWERVQTSLRRKPNPGNIT